MHPGARPSSSPAEAHSIHRGASTSPPVRFAVAATLAVVMLRVGIASRATFCGTPDSCAYLALAQSLSQHRGFVQNFLYQYQMVDAHLPQRGLEYWRPGTSFLFLLAQPFGGVSLHSSLLVTILAGVFLAAAAWRIARNMRADPWFACLAYMLCLVLPPMWANVSTPDSSLFYGAFVAWFLALFRVDFRSYAEDALAWVCLVAVNLIRNDAILLLAPVAAVLYLRQRPAGRRRGASPVYCLGAVVAFFAAALPMQAIRYAVLGHQNAPNAAEPLFFLSLSDLLFYHQTINLHTALAAGARRLIAMRAAASATIVYRIVVLMFGFGAIFLAPLLRRRRESDRSARPEWAGGAAFAGAVVAVYGLALPAIGTFSALRSANALLALVAVLMLAGIDTLTASAGARVWLAAGAILFYTVMGAMEMHRTIDAMNGVGDLDRTVARYLAAHGAGPARGAVVMTSDAAQFSTTTSYPAVPIPSNGTAATLQAVHDLHPAFVLVQTDWSGDYEAQLAKALQPAAAERVPGTPVTVLTLGRP